MTRVCAADAADLARALRQRVAHFRDTCTRYDEAAKGTDGRAQAETALLAVDGLAQARVLVDQLYEAVTS